MSVTITFDSADLNEAIAEANALGADLQGDELIAERRGLQANG